MADTELPAAELLEEESLLQPSVTQPITRTASQYKRWLDLVEITDRPTLDYQALVDILTECAKLAHERHENYHSNEHKETPVILKALTDNVDGVMVPLLEIIKLNGSPNMETRVSGAWRALDRIIRTLIRRINAQLKNLPLIPESESLLQSANRKINMVTVKQYLKEYIEELACLKVALPYLVNIEFHPGKLSDKELEDECAKNYLLPFWYSYSQELVLFRHGINVLKSAIADSYKNQSYVTWAFNTAVRGVDSLIGTIFTTPQQTRQSNDLVRREASIEYIKAMWDLPERGISKYAISVTKPSIQTSVKVRIQVPAGRTPTELFDSVEVYIISAAELPFKLPSDGKLTLDQAPLPKSKHAPAPSNTPTPPNSDGRHIIIHFHGGGFVSGSPHTHEMYLREWAKHTKSIVFSINYTKSPEAIFPQATNECFFAYEAIVKHNLFGILPNQIIMGGDSAGGNLSLATYFRAQTAKLKLPGCLFLAYPACNLTRTVYPTRLLFANDVLLAHYLLSVCLDSYLPEKLSRSAWTDPVASPIMASEEQLKGLPDKLIFFSASYDPLLDDTCFFLEKLRKVGKQYRHFLFDLPHGFLNFVALLPSSQGTVTKSCELFKEFFVPE